MKRLLLMMSLLALNFQSFAEDIYISSWVELTDMVLRPDDCIIKGEFDDIESFSMPEQVKPREEVIHRNDVSNKSQVAVDKTGKLLPESTKEQYPQATVDRSKGALMPYKTEHDKQAAPLEKFVVNNEPKFVPFEQRNPEEKLKETYIPVGTIEKNADAKKELKSGSRYYVEEDSWWKTKDRTREARRLVLVPAEQRNACWRTVTVIKPKIFWNGYKYAGTFFTYEDTQEYRFSSPLKVATLLSLLSAGIFACYKTL